MEKLRIYLIGPPIIEWKGHSLALPRRKVRALLYRLATELQPVARDRLIDLFWNEVSDSQARRNLTHLLTHLRNALPQAEMVQATHDFVFLNPDRVWSDTYAFLTLFRIPYSAQQPQILDEAMALFRGPFLDGLSLSGCPDFEQWLVMERTCWQRRHQLLLTRLIQQNVESGNLREAISNAQTYLLQEPFEPDMHRALVEMYLSKGDAEYVLQQYERIADLIEVARQSREALPAVHRVRAALESVGDGP